MVGGAEALAGEQPLRADHGFADEVGLAIERDRLRAGHLEVEFEVILQVRADAGAVGDYGDAVRGEFGAGADAGEFEQLHRVDRAAGEDHLAGGVDFVVLAVAVIGDAGGFGAFEQDFRREGVFDDGEVGAFSGGVEIGFGGGAAGAIAHGHVHAAEAFLAETVVILGARIAGLDGGIEPGLVERVLERAIGGGERAVAAAIGVAALLAAFGAFEIGQHLRVIPAARAFFLPAFEIQRIAAHIDEAVDRGRTAEAFAARAVEAAVVEVGLGLAVVAPVPALGVHRIGQRGGHLDEDRAVRAAGFEQ